MRRSLPFVLPLLIAAAPAGAFAQVTVDPNALQKLGGAALPAPPEAAAPHAKGRTQHHAPRHRHTATGHKTAAPSNESAAPAVPPPATGKGTTPGGPPPGITLAPAPPPLPPAVGQPGKPVPLPVVPPEKKKEKTKPVFASPPPAEPQTTPPVTPPPAVPVTPAPVAPKPVTPPPAEETPPLPTPAIPPPAAMPLPGMSPEKGGVPANAGANLPPAPTAAPPLPGAVPAIPAAPKPAAPALPPGTQVLTLPLGQGDTDLPAAEQSMLRDFAHGRAQNSPLYTIRAFATAPADDTDPSTPRRIALSRARAVQEALIAAGVPGDHIRLLALGAAGGSPPDRVEILASPPTH